MGMNANLKHSPLFATAAAASHECAASVLINQSSAQAQKEHTEMHF